MTKTVSRIVILGGLFVLGSTHSVAQTSFPAGFETYFPQVAGGGSGPSIETVITLTNPSDQPLSLTIGGQSQFIEAQNLELAPGETREIRITRDGPLDDGFIKLTAEQVVAASGQLITRSELGAEDSLAEVSVLAQEPFSKFVFPIFRNNDLADETGIAFVMALGGPILITLRDAAGSEIAGAQLPPMAQFHHQARFLGELFENLPEESQIGSLAIEYFGEIPLSLAVTALYQKGPELRTVAVQGIDRPSIFNVILETNGTLTAEDIEQRFEELAQTYGFEIDVIINPEVPIAVVRMTTEVARAVGRDLRVESVGVTAPAGFG